MSKYISSDELELGPSLNFAESLELERKFNPNSIYKRRQWKKNGLYSMNENGSLILTFRNGTQVKKLDQSIIVSKFSKNWNLGVTTLFKSHVKIPILSTFFVENVQNFGSNYSIGKIRNF